jgi:multicomponent Na+:H+ antiporter subunit D
VTFVIVGSTVLTGGAVLRVAGGVFLGLGEPPSEDPHMAVESDEETSETSTGKQRSPLTMTVPAAAAVVLAVLAGCWPRLGTVLQSAAVRFQDQAAYASTVLKGTAPAHPHALAALEPTSVTAGGILTSLATAAGAALLGLASLYRKRLRIFASYEPSGRVRRLASVLQSGVVTDYVAWLVLGIACVGAAFAFGTR